MAWIPFQKKVKLLVGKLTRELVIAVTMKN